MSYKESNRIPEKDIEKVLDIMAYVSRHPDFTENDLRNSGHKTTLGNYFYGRLNDLRKAAGLPLTGRRRWNR